MPARRVLIVGQDESIKTMLHDLLEDEVVGLDAFIGGEAEVIAYAVRTRRPHLVIVDVFISCQDMEIIRQLKGDEGTCDTPVLALTDPWEGAVEAGRAGADRVLIKPFDLDVLARVVREYTN